MNFISWKKKKQATISDNSNGNLFKERTKDLFAGKVKHSLKESPRILEAQFGESLGLRTRVLRELVETEKIGIGPPDMVHVTQFDEFHHEEVGEYHYITGIDLSSEIMPIAYLNMLRLNGDLKKKDGKVSTYCCTNIFSNVDIRIRYESEKHYQVSAVECSTGTTNIQLSETLWEETFVSSCIRTIVINQDRERKLPALVEYPFAFCNDTVYLEKVIKTLCKFLPRGVEVGCDTTIYTYPTLLHNYLVDTLLELLSTAPKLYDFTVNTLKKLIYEEESENEVCYRLVLLSVLLQSGTRDLEAINFSSETLVKFYSNPTSLEQNDLPYMTELLNKQASFLISKEDYTLALPIAERATRLSSDNFQAWYNLAVIYINLQKYEYALLAINSIPQLPSVDAFKEAMWSQKLDSYYYLKPLGGYPVSELHSNEFNYISSTMSETKDRHLHDIIFGRVIMPNEGKRGCTKDIWEGACMQLGPVYGPQSKNLINFVSSQEVKSLENIDLLSRNTMANQHSPSSSKAYYLLMNIVSDIGWNGLLELRSKVFVMEREYVQNTSELNHDFKYKRLCERWLDDLFLDLYEDLKITVNSQERGGIEYSGLEWELLGLTLLRTWHFSDAVACLRTSVMARFDIVSAEALLRLYLSQDPQKNSAIDPAIVLLLVAQKASFESRFYDMCQLLNLQVLGRLSEESSVESVRNQVYALPFAENGITTLLDRMLTWIQEMYE